MFHSYKLKSLWLVAVNLVFGVVVKCYDHYDAYELCLVSVRKQVSGANSRYLACSNTLLSWFTARLFIQKARHCTHVQRFCTPICFLILVHGTLSLSFATRLEPVTYNVNINYLPLINAMFRCLPNFSPLIILTKRWQKSMLFNSAVF